MSPSPLQSPIDLWDRWIGRLQVAPWSAENQDAAKLEALLALNQNQTFSESQINRLGKLLAGATGADRAILYEVINPDVTKKRLAANQIRIHSTSLTKTELGNCIDHPDFLLYLTSQRQPHQRLQKVIVFKKQPLPIRHLYQLAIAPDHCLVLLASAPLQKIDQKFLELVKATVKNRGLRQELATALQGQTERLTTITHQLSEGLVILDQPLKIQLWNRPLQRLTGFSPLEAENQYYSQALCRPDQPNWLEKLIKRHQGLPTTNIFYDEFEIQTKKNEKRWVDISGSFLRDNDGTITQTIMLVGDISRHKDLENRKNEFISIATHELRTPITAIKGYLSLLEKTAHNFGQKEESYLQRALEANDRLVKLAEDLLQVAHVEENRVNFSLRPVSLRPILAKVITDYRPKAEKKGLKLALATPNFPTVVAADPERIEQVFANLVDNAIKYTLKGRISVQFRSVTDKLTGERQLATLVSDTGMGLGADELQTVFEKFHRSAKARASREPGTGLGLFIVKTFVEKQGGKITVKSSFRRGSEFQVTFPAVEAKTLERKK